jgi:large subunit ribosomal protein L30
MAKNRLENKLLAVIRVRGRPNVRASIAETMKRLNLKRVNNLCLIYGNGSNIGMLYMCNDHVTYGEIDQNTLSMLVQSKGINANAESIEAMLNGKKAPKDLGIAFPIRMHPPRRGYRGIKASFVNGGDLGYRGAEINTLIKKML